MQHPQKVGFLLFVAKFVFDHLLYSRLPQINEFCRHRGKGAAQVVDRCCSGKFSTHILQDGDQSPLVPLVWDITFLNCSRDTWVCYVNTYVRLQSCLSTYFRIMQRPSVSDFTFFCSRALGSHPETMRFLLEISDVKERDWVLKT